MILHVSFKEKIKKENRCRNEQINHLFSCSPLPAGRQLL
jgi:hypothetical protein